MHTIIRSFLRAQLVAVDLVDGAHRRRERGDVPGWVLITLMTAGLVAAIWVLAEDQLKSIFQRAMDGVAR